MKIRARGGALGQQGEALGQQGAPPAIPLYGKHYPGERGDSIHNFSPGLTLPLAICYKNCRVATNISHWLKGHSGWLKITGLQKV